MASLNRERREDPSGESAPLLQQPSQQTSHAGLPPVGYPEHSGMPPPPPPYDSNANGGNTMAPNGSSYFVPPPGHYLPTQQQQQQSPIIIHSPNQPSQQMVGPGGMAPYYYPFPPQQSGGGPPQQQHPQYQYPPHLLYPVQQQQRQNQLLRAGTPSSSAPNHTTTESGGLPPLNDIFNKEASPTGYGSLSTSPKIYDVPIHRLPPSGRAQQPTSGRTNNNANESSPSSVPKGRNHRRVHSDNPLLRKNRMHRRVNSGEFLANGHNRSRTLSGGNPLGRSRSHRRSGSSSSYHSMGGGSYGGASMADSSMVSMRSNIAKSSMFGGIDQEGRPLLYFPYEAIRMVAIPNKETKERATRSKYSSLDSSSDEDTAEEENYPPLTIGHLYADNPVNMTEYYEEYHRVSDDLEQGVTPQWESLDAHPLKSKKAEGKGFDPNSPEPPLLPPTNYVLAVSDDIYRRMFSEVSSAQTMPCGLFFCGHHEDVDYPSVWIPGTLVIILFGTLLFLSYYTGG